jgi:hypothetical protein
MNEEAGYLFLDTQNKRMLPYCKEEGAKRISLVEPCPAEENVFSKKHSKPRVPGAAFLPA